MESSWLNDNEVEDVDVEVAMTVEDYAYLLYPNRVTYALNYIEFIITLILIIAAIVVLKGTTKGDEHVETTWIIVYTCASIVYFLVLSWRFWQLLRPVSYLRMNKVMFQLKFLLNIFFTYWFVAFFWVFFYSSSSLDHTSQLFWLCVAFLAYGGLNCVFPYVVAVLLYLYKFLSESDN